MKSNWTHGVSSQITIDALFQFQYSLNTESQMKFVINLIISKSFSRMYFCNQNEKFTLKNKYKYKYKNKNKNKKEIK